MQQNHTPNHNESRPDSQERTRLTAGGGPSNLDGEFTPGDLIGGTYQVLRWIGAGGMGNVYCVRHTIMQTEYALKTLSADKVTEVAWRRFQNEAQAIARMSHPNIVGIYNLGLHDGRLPYYVMDLLKGQTLMDVLKDQGPMEVNLALGLFVELASGLGYAHKKGIVHRDIKPPNIVLLDVPEASCRAKIVDFGIAKLSGIKDPKNQYLTNVGEVCGSPYYMSPEQAQGQRIDARSDIYSLGCTLFEVLTGVPPLRGPSAVNTMLMHQTTAPPTLKAASGGKEFPEMLEQVIATLLAKAPMDRYQTMELVAQDLSTIIAGDRAAINPFGTQPQRQVRQADGTDKSSKHSAIGARPGSNNLPTRRYQPESEEEDSRSRAPLTLMACFSLSLVSLLLAGGYWWSNQGKGKAAEIKAPVAVEDAAKRENDFGQKLFADDNQFTSDKKSVTREDINKQPPTVSLHETKPFSHMEKVDGLPSRVFSFPKDIAIGDLSSHHAITPVPAMGNFTFNEKDPVSFAPDKVLLKYPQYLKRFSAGDIYELKIEGQTASDELYKLVSQLPGVAGLEFADCPFITASIMPDIDKMTSLKILAVYKNGPKASDLSHLTQLTRLRTICFCYQDNSDPYLKLIRNSRALDCLDLHNSKVSHQGFEYIATLPNLTRLELNHAKFSAADLQILADMPKLDWIYLEDCKIDESCLNSLKKIKSLRNIAIKDNAAFPLMARQMRDALPGVQIIKLMNE